MKNKIYILILLLFFFLSSMAQNNLVLNPGFEDTISCPSFGFGEIDKAKFWSQPLPASSTSDYYHSCNNSLISFWGIKNFTGNGYSAIGTFYGLSYDGQEYITGSLASKLISGKKYCIEFSVLPSTFNWAVMQEIGIYFSDTVLKTSNPNPYNLLLPAQFINKNGIIDDTTKWTKLSGSFIANGGEKYFIMGCFTPNYEVTYYQTGWGQGPCYYFFDNVVVYDCDAPIYKADLDENLVICKGQELTLGSHNYPDYKYQWSSSDSSVNSTLGIIKVKPDSTTTYYLNVTDFKFDKSSDAITVTVIDCIKPNQEFIIYPNPAKDKLFIEFNRMIKANTKFELYNILGQFIASYILPENTNKCELVLPSVAQGVYSYRLSENNSVIVEDKLVILK